MFVGMIMWQIWHGGKKYAVGQNDSARQSHVTVVSASCLKIKIQFGHDDAAGNFYKNHYILTVVHMKKIKFLLLILLVLLTAFARIHYPPIRARRSLSHM